MSDPKAAKIRLPITVGVLNDVRGSMVMTLGLAEAIYGANGIPDLGGDVDWGFASVDGHKRTRYPGHVVLINNVKAHDRQTTKGGRSLRLIGGRVAKVCLSAEPNKGWTIRFTSNGDDGGLATLAQHFDEKANGKVEAIISEAGIRYDVSMFGRPIIDVPLLP